MTRHMRHARHVWMPDTCGCPTHVDARHTDTCGCPTHVDARHMWMPDTCGCMSGVSGHRDTCGCPTHVTHLISHMCRRPYILTSPTQVSCAAVYRHRPVPGLYTACSGPMHGLCRAYARPVQGAGHWTHAGRRLWTESLPRPMPGLWTESLPRPMPGLWTETPTPCPDTFTEPGEEQGDCIPHRPNRRTATPRPRRPDAHAEQRAARARSTYQPFYGL